MKHKCPREQCGYEWDSRVKHAKQCPRCKFYLPLAEFQKTQKKKIKETKQ